jgi:hypothetical protein
MSILISLSLRRAFRRIDNIVTIPVALRSLWTKPPAPWSKLGVAVVVQVGCTFTFFVNDAVPN